VELRGQQALELPARALLLAAAAALALAGTAHGQAPTAPVYDSRGNLVGTPFAPVPAEPVLSEDEAIQRALAAPKIASWLERYPQETLTNSADFGESGVPTRARSPWRR
jgi:hypothetical protein